MNAIGMSSKLREKRQDLFKDFKMTKYEEVKHQQNKKIQSYFDKEIDQVKSALNNKIIEKKT